MCSDLGSRRISDEISAMEGWGVEPVHRLVCRPRISASIVLGFMTQRRLSGGDWTRVTSSATTSAQVDQLEFFLPVLTSSADLETSTGRNKARSSCHQLCMVA